MKNNFKKIIIASICMLLALSILAGICFGVASIYRYYSVRVLCDQIRAGKDIDTNIGDGITAPKWINEFAVIMQMSGPRIPLVEACYYRNVQAVEVLLKNGADPNFFIKGRFSPLQAATVYGPIDEDSVEIIKLLIKHNADVNDYGSFGPLIIQLSEFVVAGNDNALVEELIILLLKNGADCNWEGYNRVLFYSVMARRASIVSSYFELRGNDINILNDMEQSLLIALILDNTDVESEYIIDMVNLLLQHGIDTEIVDLYGYTALDYAKQYKMDKVVELLS